MGAVRFGPSSFSVRGLTDVAIPNGTSVGPIAFRFPRALFVTGLVISTANGLASEVAALEVRIQDETFQDIITTGWTEQHETGCAGLSAMQMLPNGPIAAALAVVRPYPLQRPVNVGDEWFITIGNRYATPVTPELHFLFDDGEA